MRTTLTILTCLFVLAACGGDDDGAANAAKLKDLEKQYRALNAEMAEKSEAWQQTLNAVIPARQAWLRAKGSDGEAAAKAAFDAANAAASTVSDLKEALRRKIQAVQDEMKRLKKR